MERFCRLLYYYIMTAIVLFVVYLVVMLAIAPKKDALKRGFIPCTEQLVVNVGECERGQMICPLKYLWQDTVCNTYVIFDGFGAWVRGIQSSPWASYLFEPQTEIYNDSEEANSNDMLNDMQDMEKIRKMVEQKQEELEQAKQRELNLDTSVLTAVSEDDESSSKLFDDLQADKTANTVGAGDIADEAFSEEIIPDSNEDKKTEKSETDVKQNIMENGEKNEK